MVTINSDIYKQDFYGILNAQGDFWTPLAFESEKAAKEYLAKFVALNPDRFQSILRTHTFVPVRIQLTAKPGDPA